MTEKKTAEAQQATELTEEQLSDVQGAGVAMPDALPTTSDVVMHEVRKQGGEQQDVVVHE